MKNILKKPSNAGVQNSEKSTIGKNNKRIIKISFIILLLAIFAFYVYSNTFIYKGEVEALIVPCIVEVPGKILESDIALGQAVKKDDIIAKIDNTDLNYNLAQLELTLSKRKLALGDMTLGNGSQANNAYLAAQANYNSASVSAQKTVKDYETAKILYGEGGISGSELDRAKILMTSAVGLESTALAQLNNTLSQTGQNTAQIDIAILETQISQAKDNLAKYSLIAPCDGIILSKNYNKGSIVSAGYNIADIASSEEMYIVFYVPESKVGNVQYGDEIQVTVEGETMSCKVKYIDIKSQYTPKELQTTANKSKTNFKIKLLVPQPTNLKPGMQVTVSLKK